MTVLFRKEALEGRHRKFAAPIRVKGVPSINLSIGALGAVFAGLVSFGLIFSYDRKVDVSGYLAPDGGAITLSPDAPGILEILVENGARVTRGQRVATLTSDQVDRNGVSHSQLEIDALIRRRALADERARIATRRLERIEPDLLSDEETLMGSVRLADTRLKLALADLELASDQHEKQVLLLQKGLTTQPAQSAADQARLAAEGRVLEAKSQIESLVGKIARIRREARDESVQLDKELIVLREEIDMIEMDILRARSRQVSALTAPIEGTLTFAQAQQHERAAAGQPLFKIRAENAPHVGVLLAPTWAIGFLSKGDEVRIRYAAFPYQEYGTFTGRVLRFDSVAQAPSEIDAPLTVAEPVFRVFVEIEQAPLSKSGTTLRLSQGMLMDASIVIDSRPIIWWLLDPVV